MGDTGGYRGSGGSRPLPGPPLSQYEDAFSPPRLQNWSVPLPGPKPPKHSEGSTPIIANDRGHLLPSVPRSQASPWGSFVGTWEMPSRIPPARLDLTARSAAAADRLLQHLHQCSVLSSARNGLRTRITGTVRAPHPPPDTGSSRRDAAPAAESSRRSSVSDPLPEGTGRECGRC
ncbi:protein Flattop [Melopsittacus undulatus]|uniref:protein Flattop n=1 Tax=Melopsittacus undulatus TaxID=13146 RepID=UPI00146C9202|nr:protein Flattop [Melopsittacus undulatus]